MRYVPEVALEDWRGLYDAAIEFKKLKSWEWMYDSEIFGVKNPADGEIGYCCIMGNLGEFFALAAYQGTEGLISHQRIMVGDIPEESIESIWVQKCLMASFEDREQLDNRDRNLIRQLGLKFRGRGEWPCFRSYRPGFFPWYLTSGEVRFLTLVLQQAVQVTPRVRENHHLLDPPEPGKHLVRVFQDGDWQDSWQPPAPWEKPTLQPILDQTLLDELANSEMPHRGTWELGCIRLPSVVEDKDDRPFYPYVFLMVDQGSGLVLGVNICAPKEIVIKVPASLMETFQQTGSIPSRLLAANEDTFALVKPIADALHIRLRHAQRLRALEPVLEHMARFW